MKRILRFSLLLLFCVFTLHTYHRMADFAAYRADVSLDGMGGGDKMLPTIPPDGAIDPLAFSQLYYSVYIVQKGDIVGKIAQEYGVSQDAIISVNKLKNTRALQIGQILKIPSITGIVYTVKDGDTATSVTDNYKISLEKFSLVNSLKDDTLTTGSVVFLPDAKMDWATLQEINGDLFLSPLRSYRFTSAYGWRRDPFNGARSFHNGVDLAASKGTPVYPALAGTVTSVGYNSVYGNYIIIRHHSGYQTMYGHLSAVYTRTGAYVYTNTHIGAVGSTGRSTGPHLHFTVYKNGATINPLTVWIP
ncbi:MAG: M23 family metallopeptidase [Spirochaetaceae bacterium]|nr:M23 family metallopeptidase [Spirochaetaceae bacterium]